MGHRAFKWQLGGVAASTGDYGNVDWGLEGLASGPGSVFSSGMTLGRAITTSAF